MRMRSICGLGGLVIWGVLLSAIGVRADELVLSEWRGLVPEPALQIDGKPALAWPDIAKNTSIAAVDAPTDFTPYETIAFAVHVDKPTKSTLTLVFGSENAETEGADYYSLSIPTDFSGWRHFRWARRLLGGARKPLGWDRIDRVFLSSNWAHNLDPSLVVHVGPVVLDTAPIPGLDRPEGELLPNRSFEVVNGGRDVPAGWSAATFGTETTVSVDRDHARSGSASVRISGAPGGNRGGISKGFGPEETDASALYLMSAWVKTEGRSESALATSVRFTSVNADGKVIKSDYRQCTTAPYDWRFHTWFVSLPEATARFNIVLFHHGDGTAWWDDVSLRPVAHVSALAPEPQTAVGDARPEFRWQAPQDATGTLVITSTSGESFYREEPVKGDRHRLEQPLPKGRGYRWYVLLESGGTASVAAFPGEEGPVPGEFYAGSWQERIRDRLGDLSEYRDLYKQLKPLADRNGMWDPFSLLGDLLTAVEAIETKGALPAGMTEEGLMSALDELRLRAPWWRSVFLDNASLFDGLRLDLPELAAVREAVSQGRYEEARRALRDYYREREAPSYYRKWESRPAINPARTNDLKADGLLTHEMAIHSYEKPTFDLTREFNWHVFPIVDVEWPTKIHRHFHWSSLANAYWATDNDSYARELALQLLDWAQDNPMERWDRHRYRWAWSTLNATVRIYSSWINGWLRVRSSEAWTPDVQFAMLTLLREHGRFLMTHHAKTGNWVVAEARGLVELGIMFPEFKEAEEWREEGFRRLRREIDIQVLEDGIHVERTPGYHSMTLSCFLEPLKLALLNEVDFEGKEHFLDRIESMHELYLYGSRPDRRMAQIGDGGPMSVVSLLRRGWTMFGREDMLFVATDGDAGKAPVHLSYAFESGGFYVSRSAWADANALWSIMDWGGFVGHCHEDMGQICLYAHGAPLLIDSGRYSYAWPMRAYFYQTRGHNTVMVDETTQKRRDPLSCTWVSCGHFDLTRGVTDNSEPLLHERTFVFKQPSPDAPGYWVVVDRLTGTGAHKLDQRWHASEKLEGTVAGATAVFLPKAEAGEHPALTVAGLEQAGMETTVDEGWVSYKWYEKEPVDVAQFSLRAEVPAVFVTVLYPTPAAQTVPAVRVTRVPADVDGVSVPMTQAVAFEVTVDDPRGATHDLWMFSHGDDGVMSAGSARLNGRMARVALAAPTTSWMAAESATLAYDGASLFESADRIAAVSRIGNDVVGGDTGGLRIRSDDPCRLNGGEVRPPAAGVIAWDRVAAPVPPAEPKAFEEARVEIAPPPEMIPATGFAAMLPVDAEAPEGAVLVNATDFSDQGGGAVESTSRKVGTDGPAFLHWDHAGHWLEYTLAVPEAGRYRLLLKACTAEAAAMRRIAVDGDVADACHAQELAGTGGYSSNRDDWRIFTVADLKAKPVTFELPAGTVTVRLDNVDGRSLNLNWLALVPDGQ